eukprot:EC795710.1.p4 GENE.EC795710.1~~EC795710.1.p4  ORF type:complete len:86 (+),score=20.07 EC795710.1:234-491(+)
MHLWDRAGQDEFKTLRRRYYAAAAAAVIAFSSTDRALVRGGGAMEAKGGGGVRLWHLHGARAEQELMCSMLLWSPRRRGNGWQIA